MPGGIFNTYSTRAVDLTWFRMIFHDILSSRAPIKHNVIAVQVGWLAARLRQSGSAPIWGRIAFLSKNRSVGMKLMWSPLLAMPFVSALLYRISCKNVVKLTALVDHVLKMPPSSKSVHYVMKTIRSKIKSPLLFFPYRSGPQRHHVMDFSELLPRVSTRNSVNRLWVSK